MLMIDNISIEVTRKCNMECEHCLRGDSINMNIGHQFIDQLFSKIDAINSLTITGGEPSLNVPAINYIIKSVKKYNIEIGNFFIATNGKHVPDSFLLAIMKLYCLCSDNEISGVHISSDIYHEELSYINKDKLSVFKFTNFDSNTGKYDNPEYILSQGYAKYWGEKESRKEEFIFDETFIEEGENEKMISEGVLYLNCHGYIIAGCDWSYDNQDNKENIICHVADFNYKKVLDFASRTIDQL